MIIPVNEKRKRDKGDNKMNLLKPLSEEAGYLKAGFLGKNKSGKTYTATLLALGLHEHIGSKKPIAFFDTEGGSPFVREMIQTGTKIEPIGIRSRALSDLATTLDECVAGASDILIVDSITHPWRECIESYLDQVNKARAKRSLHPRKRLEFQDWGPLKEKWNNVWATPFANAPIHIVICGRAGDIYEYVENQETGKKELQVTGVKMKTETEFGFEPSLLVEMEREQVKQNGTWELLHVATVIGDRFAIIDGKKANNPGFDFFFPHIKKLKLGSHAPIDASLKTDFGVTEEGDAEVAARRKQCIILLEKIEGAIVQMYPGQTKEEKKAKVDLIETVFATKSWKEIGGFNPEELQAGLERIEEIRKAKVEQDKEKE